MRRKSLQLPIEVQTIEQIWKLYAEERLPPQEIATSYTLSQVQEAFISAFWAALEIEQRTRARSRRSALFRRWRMESKNMLRYVFGQF